MPETISAAVTVTTSTAPGEKRKRVRGVAEGGDVADDAEVADEADEADEGIWTIPDELLSRAPSVHAVREDLLGPLCRRTLPQGGGPGHEYAYSTGRRRQADGFGREAAVPALTERTELRAPATAFLK
ncbi:hypothetical protein [Streptomyces winkii]|uniref:hypothetical protein n=1 Tax=Streptomyces winkii TaxID=3051178 RepID=UPI0028D6ACAD|nr:hypothetical protein [Streptomyces sp. DSM 40971]